MDYFNKLGVKRPPTLEDIPARFDILDPVTTVLEGALEIKLLKDGSLDIPDDYNNDNLRIDISALEDSQVSSTIDEVLIRKNFIFGYRLSAPRLHPTSLSRLIEAHLTAGVLNYLVELDLSYFEIDHRMNEVLCATINPAVSGYCPIKRLVLTRTGLGVHGASAIFTALAGNTFLEEFIVNGNRFTDSAVYHLIKFLSHPHSKLRILGLGSNDITQRAMAELSPCIGAHPFLEELLLNNNPIGDDGADYLFKQLRDNNKLKALNLGGCSLKKCRWGGKLSVMLCMRDITLSQNMIDDEGFQSLCDGLLACVCLRHIDLSYNRFGGEICKMIGHVVRENKGLLSINLSGNDMHPEVWKALAFSLAENTTLNHLDIRWCGLNQLQAQHFCSSLCDNQICTVQMDYNPVSYHIRADPRQWDPEEHVGSLGSDTLGFTMSRKPNAPTLRELRKKLKAAQARQAATGKTGHEAASVVMEELEKSKDERSVNATNPTYENPIKRSDDIETDSKVTGRKPKPLLLNYSSTSINTVTAWREAKIALINDQRAVVDMMEIRAKRRAKHDKLRKGEDIHASTQPPVRTARPPPPGVLDDDDGSSLASSSVVRLAVDRLDENTVATRPTLASAGDEKSLKSGVTVHIAPALGAMKVKRAEMEANIRSEIDAGRKRILQVTYGNRLILLGGVEVEASTTYEQVRELIMPLLRNYLASAELTKDVNRKEMRNLLTNFRLLDHHQEAVKGNEAHIRTVWSELSQSGYYLDIQPATHVDVPREKGTVEGDLDSDEELNDDEDGDRPSGANAYD